MKRFLIAAALLIATPAFAQTTELNFQHLGSLQAEVNVLTKTVEDQRLLIVGLQKRESGIVARAEKLAEELQETRDQIAHIVAMQNKKAEIQAKKTTAIKHILELQHEKKH